MLAATDDLLEAIPKMELNVYKKVEMYKNFRAFVPNELWDDPLYQKPNKGTFEIVKKEREERKKFREELNEFKRKKNLVTKLKADVEDLAFGGGGVNISGKKIAEC